MSLRWNSIKLTLFLTRVCSIIVWKLQRKGVEGCNLSKITKFIFIALHLIKLPRLPKSVIPPGPSSSCLSVLVRLYNICGNKILTGFCFKRLNKLREFLKKRVLRCIQDPVKRLEWIIFVKIKATSTKAL